MAKQATWGIQVENLPRFKKAIKLLGDGNAPFLRAALNDAGQVADTEVTHFAPGAIASTVVFAGIKGAGANSKAIVAVKHPGARPMEFGRTYYYRGWTGKPRGKGYIKGSGQRFKAARGQQPRPFIGIKNQDHAVASMAPKVTKLLGDAITQEWERVLGGGQ